MRQNWEDLLFLHWAVEPELLRTLVPLPLELDTFDGKAWIGITPFRVTGLRLSALPEIPGLNSFDELNVRTYVHYKGMPGILFLSLDASKVVAAMAARLFYALPYYPAETEFTRLGDEYVFGSKRTGGPDAAFRAHWQKGVRLRDPDQDSLAFFLVERYCFFTVRNGNVEMTRVYHHPWILDEAMVFSFESTMLTSLGLPEIHGESLAHFSSFLDVEVWPPVAL
jgi:uncharacterized protein YqjF (DUF2071 family)